MKITKNRTLKNDIKATSTTVKTQKQEKAWDSLDRDVDGKFRTSYILTAKYDLPEIAACSKLPWGSWHFPEGNSPLETRVAETLVKA